MAQVLKCLACKHEDLGLSSSTHIKLAGTQHYRPVITILEEEAGITKAFFLEKMIKLASSVHVSETPCLKMETGNTIL